MWTVIWSLVVALTMPAQTVGVPDLSGRWKADAGKSARLAREVNGQYMSPIFGEECVITQTTDTLTLDIVAGGMKVQVVYRLDGKPATNHSPGPPGQPDIVIVSTAQWNGPVLHITTKSESVLDGAKVPVESVRKMWVTADGELAVERKGNPSRVVPDAWTVYTRASQAPGSAPVAAARSSAARSASRLRGLLR